LCGKYLQKEIKENMNKRFLEKEWFNTMKRVLSFVAVVILICCFATNVVFADSNMVISQKDNGIVDKVIETFQKVINFLDTASHWAKAYIEQLAGSGAIKGYTDGTFRPDNKITRAEFTAILLRALGNDVGQPENGEWYEYYMQEAINKGYVLEGEFDNVNKNITRGEMARMIVRAMNETYPDNMADYAKQIKDYSKTPDEYKEYVLKAYVKGIITGRPGGIFAYSDTATRAEASTMIVRLIDSSKRIVPELEKPFMIDGHEVVTSHPEMIPHIKKGMEIMSKQGYATFSYYPENNHIYFNLFNSKEDSELPDWVKKPILLSYEFYTERDPDYEPERVFYAYNLILQEPTNEMARNMFLEIVKDICPEMKGKVEEVTNKKLKDSSYDEMLFTKVNGRDIALVTQKEYNQIGFSISF